VKLRTFGLIATPAPHALRVTGTRRDDSDDDWFLPPSPPRDLAGQLTALTSPARGTSFLLIVKVSMNGGDVSRSS
jgi:hypothetical protein